MRPLNLLAIFVVIVAAAILSAEPSHAASSRYLGRYPRPLSTYIGTVSTLTAFNGAIRDATFDTDDGYFYFLSFFGVARLLPDGTSTVISDQPQGNAIVWDHDTQLFYITASSAAQIFTMTPQGVVTLLAGSGTSGTADGQGTAAQFQWPSGIALDSVNHQIYVADVDRMRRVGYDGTVTTVGPIGVLNGGDYEPFGFFGMAMQTGLGQVIVTDQYNSVVRAFSPGTNTYATLAGRCLTIQNSGCIPLQFDGPGSKALFATPVEVAYNPTTDLTYVADENNYEIRSISSTDVVKTIAGNGRPSVLDGIGYGASFSLPVCAALDPINGVLLVCDNGGNAVRLVTTQGTPPAPLPHRFVMSLTPSVYTMPNGLAGTSDGSLWFAEQRANYLGQVSPTGRILEHPLPGGFQQPVGAASGPNDTVYFTDLTGQSGSYVEHVAYLDARRNVHELKFYNYCGVFGPSAPSLYTPGINGDEWFADSCPSAVGYITSDHVITQFPTQQVGGLAVDSSGFAWVGTSNALEQISPGGAILKTWSTQANGGVAIAPSGKVWFDGGSYGESPTMGYVIVKTGKLVNFTLPACNCNSRNLSSIVIGPDGAAWFLEGGNYQFSGYPGTVGRMTASGNFSEYPIDQPRSNPSGIAFDKTGRLWITDDGAQKIGYMH